MMALDVIEGRPTSGIPSWMVHAMEWSVIDRLAGAPEGTYRNDPVRTYWTMCDRVGVCMIDQWLAGNPLDMGPRGYESSRPRSATTGARRIVIDDMEIREPEDVVEHLERVVFPAIAARIRTFDEDAVVSSLLKAEGELQELLGPDILKVPYAVASLPGFRYGQYGYENYFMAYALYNEVIEKDFRLQADLAALRNRAAARAYREGALPPMLRLDHDMADSRGMLVDVRSLDRIWFPHFARCLEPLLHSNVRLIWHCDGNLMDMVPRLLEVGLGGFQGFQYEDGMDYGRICGMKTRDGDDLLIIAGVSVTRTLPLGTPEDVQRELKFLVEHGPRRGLFLGASSSITPGVPWANMEALVEGLAYYRTHGRGA